MNRTCFVKGCGNKAIVKGMCSKHYQRARKRGEVGSGKICKIEGCNNFVFSRGYCHKHYRIAQREGEIKTGNKCKVEDCNGLVYKDGYCRKHFNQIQRYGKVWYDRNDPNKFIEYNDCYGIILRNCNQEFVGEAYIDKSDYYEISKYKWSLDSVGYPVTSHVRLHKMLYPNYNEIDHKNQNKLDNRRNNLRQTTRSHNCYNHGLRKDNSSGVTGVYKQRSNSWNVQITKNGVTFNLGNYRNFRKAMTARRRAERRFFGEFSLK